MKVQRQTLPKRFVPYVVEIAVETELDEQVLAQLGDCTCRIPGAMAYAPGSVEADSLYLLGESVIH